MKDLNTLNAFRKVAKEIEIVGCKGDSGNGVFEVRVGAKWFWVIASNGGGWEHVSVSPVSGNGIPTWKDMCAIKEMFFEDEEAVMQIHPKKSEYVNLHKNCLHLWRLTDGLMVLPPKEFV